MLMNYYQIFLFVVVGTSFGFIMLFTAFLFRARGNDVKGLAPYECGMDAVGSPWVSPNIRFYLFALSFVVFDAEVLFLFPWAVQFRELGVFGFAAAMIFVFILFMGLVYEWKKGALEWE